MTSPSSRAKKSVIIPILMTCLGYFCYNLSDAGTKSLVLGLHWSQVMLTSAGLMVIFMAVYGAVTDGKKAFRTNKPGLLVVRGAFAQVSTLTNLFAFPHVQLTTFYTLAFTSPFWVALISAYFLKDKLDRPRLGAILFGFLVILGIFHPGADSLDVWAMMILFSALVYSGQMVLVRHIGSGESRSLMFITGGVMSMLIAIPFLGDHYVPLTLSKWALFAGVALINGAGMLCLSYAFQEAPSAASIAPYHYTQIIWGAVLGYLLFNEVPKPEILVGSALLIAAGLYLIRHETRQKALLKPEEVK